MISVQNLEFSYNNNTRFRFPDFELKNEAMLITGKSGKGKTTFLHLLGGILKPKKGIISIENTDLGSLNEKQTDEFRGKNIGIIFQKPYFVTSLSVLENINLSSWLATGKKNNEYALKLLERLQLIEKANQKTTELSVGQQQRLSIARALINSPRILLADEPTSNLDDENCEIVARLLLDSSNAINSSLIIVTHDQRLKNLVNKQIELK